MLGGLSFGLNAIVCGSSRFVNSLNTAGANAASVGERSRVPKVAHQGAGLIGLQGPMPHMQRAGDFVLGEDGVA